MTKMNILVNINAATENEINVLKVMFGNRITIEERLDAPTKPSKVPATKKPARTQKEAEKMIAEKENVKKEEENTMTRAEAINDWKIKKYGSIEKWQMVQDMTQTVAAEWREEARKTGKFVVKKSEYKTRLYEEAEKRVDEELAKKSATKKARNTKKSR